MSETKPTHEHYWAWIGGVIEGPTPGSTVVVRECREEKCKQREMAVVKESQWEKATGDYLLDEHYDTGA